jgi:AsmA protein
MEKNQPRSQEAVGLRKFFVRKTVLWLAFTILATPFVLMAAVAILVNFIDQQTLLNKVSLMVQETQKRQLLFTGPVRLKWFPSIGAELTGVSLSEFENTDLFLKADKVEISLALFPLITSDIVVDAIHATGVTVNIVKNKEGKFNFNDLLDSNQKSLGEFSDQEKLVESVPLSFSVDSIVLNDLNMNYADQLGGINLSLNHFDFESGKIEPNVPIEIILKGNVKANKPQADLNLSLKTLVNFSWPEHLDVNFEKLKLTVMGEVDAQPADMTVQADVIKVSPQSLAIKLKSLNAQAKGKLPEIGLFDLSLNAPFLELSENLALSETLNIKADLQQLDRRLIVSLNLKDLKGSLQEIISADLDTQLHMDQAERRVSLGLVSPVHLNFKNQLLELKNLKGQLNVHDPTLPNKRVDMPLAGHLVVNNTEQTAEFRLNSIFESTKFDLKTTLNNFIKPEITALLNADKLDIDALFPTKKKSSTEITKGGSSQEKDIPIDFGLLSRFNMNLIASVGYIQVSNLQLSQLKTKMVVQGGKLTISPLVANLYGGFTSGLIVINSNNQTVKVSQKMEDVQIQPVIHSLFNKDMVEGKGNLDINLSTTGNTLNQMKSALDGKVSVSLQDGAIKGINLAERFRNAKSLLNSGHNSSQKTDMAKKTDFSSLFISFNILDGIARSNDLTVMAPLFRMSGEGQVDLINSRVDFLAKTSLVATSTGQGGKSLDSGLRGLTVPIRVFGPFASVQWELQFKDLVKEAAKAKLHSKIEEKREELKGNVQEKFRDALKGFLNR